MKMETLDKTIIQLIDYSSLILGPKCQSSIWSSKTLLSDISVVSNLMYVICKWLHNNAVRVHFRMSPDIEPCKFFCLATDAVNTQTAIGQIKHRLISTCRFAASTY